MTMIMQINDALWKTYVELGTTAYNNRQHKLADKMLQTALIEAERMAYGHSPRISAFQILASIYYEHGNYDRASAVYERALSLYQRMLGNKHAQIEHIWLNLANLYYSQNKHPQAASLYERYLSSKRNSNNPTKLMVETLSKLAGAYCSMGRYEDAQTITSKVESLKKQLVQD